MIGELKTRGRLATLVVVAGALAVFLSLGLHWVNVTDTDPLGNGRYALTALSLESPAASSLVGALQSVAAAAIVMAIATFFGQPAWIAVARSATMVTGFALALLGVWLFHVATTAAIPESAPSAFLYRGAVAGPLVLGMGAATVVIGAWVTRSWP